MHSRKILYTNQEILKAIALLGKQISADYKGKKILAIGLLKGCTVFFAHLLVHISTDVEIDFMTISSYKHGTKSENFKLIQDLDSEITDRHILIIEDIVDTGKTLDFVSNHLKRFNPASIEVAVFVYKEGNLTHSIEKPKYICFHYNQPEFLVGFGFDLQGYYRNLPDIYRLED